tara:strand:- start:2294 stop:3046 length:753 start_codon:yes stop_codon:yes gene_type:complete
MAQPVTFDVNHMLKKVDTIKQVQIPFASSLALNNLAKDIRDNYRSEMKQRFRNPVPFTLNGMYIKASSKSNLYVEVGLKEFATKGNPTSKYLLPQIQGGKPYLTRFQKALRIKGILAPGEIAIPTQSDYLKRNQYGNVMPSQYTEILYSLQAFRDSSAFTYRRQAKRVRAARQYKARTTAAFNSSRNRYFPGIYLEDEMARQEIDSALFWITRQSNLPQKFPYIPIGAAFAQKNWNKAFGQALRKAIATA